MRCRDLGARLLALALAVLPARALAWGYEGHEVVARIARGYLTPAARGRVEALLAADHDTLTAPDMASRATWADAWRGAGHRETAQWHFVDIEIDRPDLRAACFGDPAPARPVSEGPAQDCVVGRIKAFATELADPRTPEPEQILALKYLLHFVGDLHQPLHAADHEDRGGNCVLLALGGPRSVNLHSYWDTVVVGELESNAPALAAKLAARITPAEAAAWRRGGPPDWAMETFRIARARAYWPGVPAGCGEGGAASPPPGYAAQAREVAALQLEKAGVRLGEVLNRALDPNARR
jgi:hypothetical protein